MSNELNVAKEIAFWRLQIEEHMFFIHEGLVDAGLKQEAARLNQAWHNLVDANVMPLIAETLKFQLLLINKIKYGPWIGWLSLSFVLHMVKETNYFKAKLLGKITKEEEIQFWLWHHHSEVAAAEKLVDPTEEELSLLMKEYIEYVKTLEANATNVTDKEFNTVLEEYLVNNEDLKVEILNHTVATNIPPALINHVLREGYYAIDLFQ